MPELFSLPGSPDTANASDAQASQTLRCPSAIQPHGYLLCLDPHTLHIVQASENLAALARAPIDTLLGQPVERIIGQRGRAWLVRALESAQIDGMPAFAGALGCGDGDAAGLGLSVHRHDGVLIVELETQPAGPEGLQSASHAGIRTFATNSAQIASTGELAEAAARAARRTTGFGRVVVCRFEQQGRGRVIAESRDPAYATYLDQHFPTADVPVHARELYRHNPIRRIPDANYTPVPLAPRINPLTQRATDLTFAALRSIAPAHCEYMRNMGTLATMSASIIVGDALWGLIICHHHDPYKVSLESRAAFEHLAQILSLRIEAKEREAQAAERIILRDALVRITAKLAGRTDLVNALADASPDLLALGAAQGVAIVSDDEVRLLGETPPGAAVSDLTDWLARQSGRTPFMLFSTDGLPNLYPAARTLRACASGITAVPLAARGRHYVLWFRPEVIRTIEWAGRNREAAGGEDCETPAALRTSFEAWLEIVRGQSLPWRPSELEILGRFRDILMGVDSAGPLCA